MGIKWRMYRLEKTRILGKAQMRDSNATLPGYFAIQFTNTWNIYTCEQSDIEEASLGSVMTRWEMLQFLRSMHILTSVSDRHRIHSTIVLRQA